MNTYDDYANEYEREVEEFEDNYYNNGNNNSYKKGLIIKIIIIIICVILLVWLLLLLKNSKGKNVVYDEKLHIENVTKVRLASERYFFLNNNLPDNGQDNQISLKTLIDNKLIDEVVDANKKVCNDDKSKISLSKGNNYILRINLSCSTNENEEVYFYDLENLACKNCDGNTYMDGSNGVPPKEDEQQEQQEETGFSCKEWSNWQREKVNDSSLTERVRVLVKGVKKGNTTTKKVYGDWSEYILNPILEEPGVEVEKMDKVETQWSDNKETTSYIEESDTIKIVDTRTTGGGSRSYCASGYSKSGSICVSDKVYTADLTPSQYNSLYVINKPCNDVKTEYISGKYILMRKGCKYRLTDSLKTSSSPSVTTYIYQELEENTVTYYRYRTVSEETITEDDVYTTELYEENKLPEGYTKVSGSEIYEYSYKVTVCEK